MRTLLVVAALAIAASPSAQACEGEGKLANICKAPLFKQYTSCIDKAIGQWDPKGPVLSQMNMPPASSVLAVLMQCEPIAIKFAKKYGNDLTHALQSVANRRVSEQYGTEPLEPNGGR
jgi:hypothetical protein